MRRTMKKIMGLTFVLAMVTLSGCKSAPAPAPSLASAADETGTTKGGNTETLASDDTVYTIKLASPTYNGESVHEGIEKFKELAEEYSEGRLIIEHYDAAQLGSDRDTTEQVQQGILEASCCSSSNFVSFVPAFNALELPYVTSRDKIQAFNESLDNGELGQFFMEQLNGVGFQPVMYNMFGYRIFCVNDKAPLTGIESFKGIKLRTTESQAEMATVEALGASAMPLAWADTITAIEQNTVNGWATTDSYAKNCGAYEIIKYAMDTEHNLTLHLVVLNKAYYDSLPADLQEILMRAGKEATEFEREYEKKVCTEDRQFLKDQGVQYYELNDEERQQLMDITRPTWDKLAVDETTKKALELIQKTQQ
ncbi:MAG: TRAP transporter substrate-binding protein [Lachnospiraceae bacterium]|jgi:tripartite ATP-independent transporter DctP family solute receptor|nr:TRAP transporter substrate-binding protein [Lachnospiraceae bacterium]